MSFSPGNFMQTSPLDDPLDNNSTMQMAKNFVVGSNGYSSTPDSSQIQYRNSNACDVLSTSSLTISSANHSLIETKNMEDNNNRHQKKLYTNNNFYRNMVEDKSLLDTSYAAFIDMIDPLPLPPSHGNNRQSETREQRNIITLLDTACAVSTRPNEDSMTLSPSLTSLMAFQQNELKRDYDLRVRSFVPSGINYHLNYKSVLPIGSCIPIDCGSRDRGSQWTPRPTKKARITHDQSFKLTAEGPVGGTNSSKTKPTAAVKTTIPMALKCDEDYLSEYQCLVRKQIEIFEASVEEVESRDRGRNTAIVMGQVGIRCRHCAKIPARCRTRGSSYYTSTLNGLYQAAQKMTTDHFFKHCKLIPQSTVASLLVLKQDRKRAADGKRYWAEGGRSLGIRETDSMGLCLVSRPNKGGATNSKDKTTL